MRCTLCGTWTVMPLAIIGLFETKDEADAYVAYATHEYCRAMTVVEYLAKEKEKEKEKK